MAHRPVKHVAQTRGRRLTKNCSANNLCISPGSFSSTYYILNLLPSSFCVTSVHNTNVSKFKGAHIHLSEALNKLADRKSPDYRNSIKESVSAIESICQVISNDNKAELGKALKILKKTIPIHGSLEQGFIKIYGYTSDGDGIRHAMLEEPNLHQEDALFMLISCSAFVNYLIIKANKTGVILK